MRYTRRAKPVTDPPPPPHPRRTCNNPPNPPQDTYPKDIYTPWTLSHYTDNPMNSKVSLQWPIQISHVNLGLDATNVSVIMITLGWSVLSNLTNDELVYILVKLPKDVSHY